MSAGVVVAGTVPAAPDRTAEPGAPASTTAGTVATLVGLVAATAASVTSSWSLLQSNPPLGVTNVAVAFSFFLVGTLLWRGPTQRGNAVLMVLAGAFYLASWWYAWPPAWHSAVTVTVSYVGGYLWFVCAGAVLMRYPGDTFRHGYERWYFALLALWIVGVKAVLAVVGRPEWSSFTPATPWPGLVPHRAVHDVLATAFNVGIVVLAAAMLVLLVLKYRALERGLERDDAVPLLVAVWAVGALGGLYVLARTLAVPVATIDLLRLLIALAALATPLAFAVTLVRPRLLRSSIADLVPVLAAGPTDAEIEAALREQLRTERVTLRPAPGPATPDALVVALYASDGTPLGELVLSAALRRHERLVRAIGATVAMTIENRHRVEEVASLSERIAVVADEERRRIESELHNGAQPALLIVDARLGQLERRAPDALTGDIADIRARLDASISSLRDLAHGIYPPLLKQSGLQTALEETVVGPLGRDIRLDVRGEPFPLAMRHLLFSLCSESITNMVKHAGPRATMRIHVRRTSARVDLRVDDDGPGGATTAGFGLGRMRDAVRARRGRFVLDSPPGRGTAIRVVLPCE